MGWAARAKVRSGNPKEPELGATFIATSLINAQLRDKRVQWARADFSDRSYAMDRNGTLRRLKPRTDGQ